MTFQIKKNKMSIKLKFNCIINFKLQIYINYFPVCISVLVE